MLKLVGELIKAGVNEMAISPIEAAGITPEELVQAKEIESRIDRYLKENGRKLLDREMHYIEHKEMGIVPRSVSVMLVGIYSKCGWSVSWCHKEGSTHFQLNVAFWSR